MKTLILLLLLFCSSQLASATERTSLLHSKLTEVNKYWLQYLDAVPANLAPVADQRAMIKLHLQIVEKHLRQTNVQHLSAEQQKARIANLNNLQQYWQSGAFPINTTHSYRLPIFIDPFNNFCAVGYLIKASGNEHLSRHISANSNFAYLADMSYPELDKWAASSGLSFDELAWIQPGYPPSNTISGMNGGTNGTVTAITSAHSGIIYAAGDFSEAGGQPGANNVAMYYPGFAGYDWMPMGGGLNGPVKALQVYNNELYAAGHDLLPTGAMHSVSKWDGNNWVITAPIAGFVNAMAVYNNELYVAGHDLTNQTYNAFLYKWDGNIWTDLNLAATGSVHAMHEHNGKLIIGGEFTSAIAPGAPNILMFDGSQFSGIGNGVPAKVRAIASFKNNLFAGGDYLNAQGDTFGLARFDGTSWKNLTHTSFYTFMGPNINSSECFVSALVPNDTTSLMVAGDFYVGAGMSMVFGSNLASYQEFPQGTAQPDWGFTARALLNKPVHALHVLYSDLYLGGEFTENLGSPLASIGYTTLGHPNSAPESEQSLQISFYPNPVSHKAVIKADVIEALPVTFSVYNLLGQQVQHWHESQPAEGNFTYSRGQLSSGTYVLQAHQQGKLLGMQKFVVE